MTDTPPPSAPAPAPPSAPADRFRPTREHVAGRPWPIRLLGVFSSLRAAATLIGLLAVVIGIATYYERAYGRYAAAVQIYETGWFALLFFLLALNIFGAAAVRWPWKRRQAGFVIVHAGLLTIMLGFALSVGRLDGVLPVPPNADVSHVDLPTDNLTILESEEPGARRFSASFDPVAWGSYPTFAGYVAGSLRELLGGPALPRGPKPVHEADRTVLKPTRRFDPELDVYSAEGRQAGLLKRAWRGWTKWDGVPWVPADFPSVRVRRVAMTAQEELGFAPAASGAPALHAVLSGRMGTPDTRTIADGWLALGADEIEAGPATLSLGVARFAGTLDDLLTQPPDDARALVVRWQDQVRRVPLDGATLPLTVTLAPECEVVVDSLWERPVWDGQKLVDEPHARLDPLLIVRVGTGPAETRQWASGVVFALRPLSVVEGGPLPADLLYQHPVLTGAGGRQGLHAQFVRGPDGGYAFRRISLSRGWLGGERLAADGRWSGALVESEQMRLDLAVVAHPHAEPAPVPRAMQPDRADGAARWIEIEVRRGDATGRAWLRRGGEGGRGIKPVRLSDGSTVLAAYRNERYDLMARHGIALRLERFYEDTDPGGGAHARFASDLTVTGRDGAKQARHVTMNAPLTIGGVVLPFGGFTMPIGGVTFYQSSFVPERDEFGRPVPGHYAYSVFQAATDPGRLLKYLGSAVLVAGILVMYLSRRRAAASTPAAP